MSDIVKGKKPGGCPPPPPPRPPRHRPPKDMPFPPPPPPPPVFPGPCCPPTSTLVLNNTVVESDDGSITVKTGYYKGRPAYFLSINSDLVKPNLAGAPPIRIEEEEIDGKPYQVVYVDPTIGSGSEPCIPSKPTAEDLDKFLRGDGQWSAITIPEQVQANWTEEDSGEPSFIQNKPELATVATTGSYEDLEDKPDIPAAQIQSDWEQSDENAVDFVKNKPELATVATTGDYADLENKPNIPAAQIQSDWTQDDDQEADFIKNKPALATVATTGSYNDLVDTPDIPVVDQSIDENSQNAISNRAVALALKQFGGFEVAEGTGDDHHPNVQTKNPKLIYLVEDPNAPDPDHYYEWIWVEPSWKCIGTATIDLTDYYTKTEVDQALATKLNIVDFHDTTYTAGNGLSLTSTEFKITPDSVDDGYFTTKNNQVVWVPDQFVTIITPDIVPPARSLRLQFTDTSFDPSTYEWPTTTSKVHNATWTSQGNGIWDMTYDNADWSNLMANISESRCSGVPHFDIIAGDCTDVTTLYRAFTTCDLINNFSGLTNTDSVKNITEMFAYTPNIVAIELPDMNAVTSITCFTSCTYYGQQTTALKSIKIGDLNSCTLIKLVAANIPSIESIELGDLPLITSTDNFDLYVPLQKASSASGIADYYDSPLKSIKIGDMVNLTNASNMFYTVKRSAVDKKKYECGSYRFVERIELGSMPKLSNAKSMFRNCTSLTACVDVGSTELTTVYYMFYGCTNVESGILDVYNKLSAIDTLSSETSHQKAFYNCGSNTVSGSAELADIPAEWK